MHPNTDNYYWKRNPATGIYVQIPGESYWEKIKKLGFINKNE